jgi:hypothetical protein
MTADSNRFADALMEPFEAAALRQRRATQRQLRGMPPLEPGRPETLGELWNSPTPGSLFDIAQGIASGFRGAGRALSGEYTVQPETPGQWSEAENSARSMPGSKCNQMRRRSLGRSRSARCREPWREALLIQML